MTERTCRLSIIATHKGGRDYWLRFKYVDGVLQNLQSVSPYEPCPPTLFSFLGIMVKQAKPSSQKCRYQRVKLY